MKDELQKLKHSLPELPDPDREKEKFKEVWAGVRPIWTERLRAIMIKYCNIGHDWQFSEDQIELLRQYHNANELLLECLDSDYVSQGVRQEIEEALLLPSLILKSTVGYDLHKILVDLRDYLLHLWLNYLLKTSALS